MSLHIALLRGINVGGNNIVSMASLRELLAGMGLDQVQSLLQSGNLVFNNLTVPTAELEARLEREAGQHLALHVDFVVRSAAEWARVVALNPFQPVAKTDPARLLVMFLKQRPTAPQAKALEAAATGPERVRVIGQQIYIVYPNGVGVSRLKLDARGTARNWNTVMKLAALAGV